MAAGGEFDEFDSLFEGMDLVSPASIELDIAQHPHIHDPLPFAPSSASLPPSPSDPPSVVALNAVGASLPLDHATFSQEPMPADSNVPSIGYSLEAAVVSNPEHTSPKSGDVALSSRNGQIGAKSNHGMIPQDSVPQILAEYDRAMSKPSVFNPSPAPTNAWHALDVVNTKPASRRKKRSLKIGYGRGSDDFDEGKATIAGKNTDDLQRSVSKPEAPAQAFSFQGVDTIVIGGDDVDGHAIVSDIKKSELAEHIGRSNGDSNVPSHPEESSRLSVTRETVLNTDQIRSHSAGADEGSEEPATDSLSEDLTSVGDSEGPVESVSQETSLAEVESREDANVSDTRTVDNIRGTVENEVETQMNDTADDDTKSIWIDNSKGEPCLDAPSGYTLAQRFDFIKSSVAKELECLQRELARISQVRKAAAQKRRHAGEEVNSTSANFQELESELEVACESEDFERAENLTESIAAAEKAREVALDTFRITEADCDSIALKMQEVLKLQIATEEQGAKLLRQLGEEAVDAAERLKMEAEERAGREINAWTVEEEAVKVKKMKLNLELRAIEEANVELSKVMDESVHAESKERQSLFEKRAMLAEELQKLQAMVRAKEVEIAENDKCIADVEEKIGNVVARFEKECTDLKTDYEGLAYSLQKLESESEHLTAKKIEAEANLVRAQEETSKLEEFAKLAEREAQTLQDELQLKKTAAAAALHSRENRITLASKEKEAAEMGQALRQQASSVRTSLQDLASEKMKLQQDSTSVNHRILFLEKRGPEIETEKKLAAAARNFKEAGRLAAEAKALHSDKVTVMSDLERITTKLQNLEQELEACVNILAEIDNQICAKEREAAMARCERLRLLAAATRDERDAAIELEDFEEAENLHSEAETADAEADNLQRLHCFEGNNFERSKSSVSKMSSGLVGLVESGSTHERVNCTTEEDSEVDAVQVN